MANIICTGKRIVGHKEMVTISFDGKNEFLLTATMDTGNSGIFPTIGANILEQTEEKIRFIVQASYCKIAEEVVCDIEGAINPKVGKDKQNRPVVKCAYIKTCGKKVENTYVAVADRSFKKTQALINRNLMTEMRLIVDPSAEFNWGDDLKL